MGQVDLVHERVQKGWMVYGVEPEHVERVWGYSLAACVGVRCGAAWDERGL